MTDFGPRAKEIVKKIGVKHGWSCASQYEGHAEEIEAALKTAFDDGAVAGATVKIPISKGFKHRAREIVDRLCGGEDRISKAGHQQWVEMQLNATFEEGRQETISLPPEVQAVADVILDARRRRARYMAPGEMDRPIEVFDRDREPLMLAAVHLLGWASGLSSEGNLVREKFRDLVSWVPESGFPSLMKGQDHGAYGRTREELRGCPFFTEAFTYELLGKEDARTLLALVRELMVAAGIPRMEQHEIECEAHRENREEAE